MGPPAPIPVSQLPGRQGQETAKRTFEIAAGGGHNILMVGPLGSGKTMLAKRFSGTPPNLSRPDADEVIANVEALPLQLHRSGPLLRVAFDIACELNRTVYDTAYLVLAASLDCQCFTADHALATEAQNSRWGRQMAWLGDWTPHRST